MGAFVIALCQTLRLGMKLLDSMTQDAQDKNMVLKLGMKCVQCCMWCLQKTVEFVSYYGYVYVAIEGDNQPTNQYPQPQPLAPVPTPQPQPQPLSPARAPTQAARSAGRASRPSSSC